MANVEHSDQRRHPRVAYFLVPVDREQLPVWLFKPEGLLEATAALVVNASAGGVQVLASADSPDPPEEALLSLILGDDEGQPPYQAAVRRVWSRPFSTFGQLQGYEFAEAMSPAQEYLRTYRPALEERKWVRCVLSPA